MSILVGAVSFLIQDRTNSCRKALLNDVKAPVLHQAAQRGNARLVKIFLEYGAHINHRDCQGQTALHLAMAGGHERAAWALISNNAKVDVEDKDGLTPLMHGLLAVRAAMDSESPMRAVSVLAQFSEPGSLQVQQEKLEDVVKLKLTSRSELISAARDGQVQDVKSCLQKLADPNITDYDTGMTPLWAALTAVVTDPRAHDEDGEWEGKSQNNAFFLVKAEAVTLDLGPFFSEQFQLLPYAEARTNAMAAK